MRTLASVALCAALSACTAVEVRDEGANSHQAAQAFGTMKQLVGRWSGTANSGDNQFPVTFSYRLASGGNTLLEDMFEGTEHEMLTLYHLDGSDLRLTHYCAAGNQPSMVLVSATGVGASEPTLTFEFDRGTNMASPKEGHMHRASYTILGPDHVLASWAYFADGKLDHEAHFDLTRESVSGTR
ncbi:MAG: hypothetical protein HOP15_10305 [Planctomycetes bacterium]|nr:hypothetical protein [Planctomycetota bacterium]